MDIAIVDYGVGNLRSAQKAIEHGGHEAVITADAAVLRAAPRIILPGVGAFGAAITQLRESGLDDVVMDAARSGKPVLGICLGMQLLLSKGYELGEWDGLGLVPGDVVKFDAPGLKIPQIGWNTIEPTGTSPLLNGVDDGMMFYFVHSFYCRPADAAAIGGTTEFGGPYCSVIASGNIHGAQFHPEKSGKAGLRFLKNFAELPS
ncbi:MAG TPA: imidazole glycerol phosphate synthase subunit HisH [Armatimonadota bacterium]|jgi:glutamine amidotransferase